MISCLMVTQPARLASARMAIHDFARQTHADRELIVLHDGDDLFDTALAACAAQCADAIIRIVRVARGKTLGALRNESLAVAHGDFVCQWDDDDRYHPQRLALQWQALRTARADFCFLSDQLHWFAAGREMYWDDWHGEAYPFNLVQGTLLGDRRKMPAYPDIARGEDTGLLRAILQAASPIVRLRDVGWCYVYVYHGANAWDAQHHSAISKMKAHGHARLIQRVSNLRERLAEYQPGFGPLQMPHADGSLDLSDPTATTR